MQCDRARLVTISSCASPILTINVNSKSGCQKFNGQRWSGTAVDLSNSLTEQDGF